MSMLYAVEAWIMAIVGWAWITLRDMIPERPLMEELCAYSTLVISSINLILASFIHDKAEVSKAYLGFTLMLWNYLIYSLIDGIKIYDTGSHLVPRDLDLCCPNRDVPSMNRFFYFGGLSAFLGPGAVTFAFQTVQVLISGGSLVAAQGSVWPGNGWGYGVAAILSVAYFLRFAGIVAPPCPGGAFRSLLGLDLNIGFIFGIFSIALSLLIILDGIEVSSKAVMLGLRGAGLAVVSLFCVSVCLVSHGLGMLTFAVILLLGKAWLPVAWGFLEPLFVRHIDQPPADPVRFLRPKRAMRWVVPIQAKLDKVFPCPIRVDPTEVAKKTR